MWDNRVFTQVESITNRHFIFTMGRWIGVHEPIFFANIYGSQSDSEKATLWEELPILKQNKGGIWVLMRDFNVVRRPDEWFNSVFCARSASDFNNFIHENGLIDIKMGGHRFTYFHNGDLKLSKLDRFLVCPKFIDLAPSATVIALPREISDHCPILLSTSWCDFGPPPFKMFNSWLSRDGFEKVFISAWNNFIGYGTQDLYMNAKLKCIK